MRFRQIAGIFFLIVIVGCYTRGTFIAIYETGNASELADFPFGSEEQEEESKEGKEKEKEKEYDEENKELAASQQDLRLNHMLVSQKRKGLNKHYTAIFIEVFTPPPDDIS
jgi:hypothetical protein